MRSANAFMIALVVTLLVGCVGDGAGPGLERENVHPDPDASAQTGVDPACVHLDVTADTRYIGTGETVVVRAVLTNACDAAIVVQGVDGCSAHALKAAVIIEDARWSLRDGPAVADDACLDTTTPAAITIEPGATLHESWTWNASLLLTSCDGEPCREWRPAPAGDHVVTAWLVPDAQGVTGETRATTRGRANDPDDLRAPGHAFRVENALRVNATGDGRVPADLGGHCAAAHDRGGRVVFPMWREDALPHVAVLRVFDRDTVDDALRHADAAPGPSGHVLNALDEETGTLSVPATFNGTLTLFEVTLTEDDVLVDGEPVAPGDAFNVTRAYTVHGEDVTLKVTETLAVTYVGELDFVAPRPPGYCF